MDELDRHLRRLTTYLLRRLPPSGLAGRIGRWLAGTGPALALPVDRRRELGRPRPGADRAAGPGAGPQVAAFWGGKWGGDGGGGGESGSDCDCSESQYCYLHGRPCKCCGGTDTTCPSGTTPGGYWSYCCDGTRIYFRDCCGEHSCPSGTPFCNNSSQPNWCNGAGGNRYVCTLAEPHGGC